MSDKSFSAFRVYDKNGLQLTLSFPLRAESADAFSDSDAVAVQNAIDTALRNGFTLNAPDAEEGEEVRTVGFFAKRAKLDRNGEEIPVIDIYSDTDNPEFKYKMLSLYINNDEDAQEFEAGTGVKISDIPLYDGDAPLERWSVKAPKYLLPVVRKPTRIGLRHNPAYNPNEADPKLKKPQWKFSRWLVPSATPSGSAPAAPAALATASGAVSGPERPPSAPALVKGSRSETTRSASSAGASGSTAGGATKIEHWSKALDKRRIVADAFDSFGIHGTLAVSRAMQELEPGVKRLGETRYASADDYVAALRAHYETRPAAQDSGSSDFSGWTPTTIAQFEGRLAALYPDILPADIRDALGVNAWIETPDAELARIAALAAEEGWRVGSQRVSYHQGKTQQDTYIVFQTPIGMVRTYSRTKLAEMLGAGWARANGVERWNTLGDEETRAIEPVIITWETKTREDGSVYRMAERIEAVDKLDQVLQAAGVDL